MTLDRLDGMEFSYGDLLMSTFILLFSSGADPGHSLETCQLFRQEALLEVQQKETGAITKRVSIEWVIEQ